MNPIVFGFDSYNTSGSIRCLGEAGYSPIVILVTKNKRVAAKHSKYIGEFIQVSNIEGGIEALLKLKNPDKKNYVFATSDKIATALDWEYDRLCDSFIFPNVGVQGGLTKAMDKEFQCELAKKSGINVPYSIAYHKGDPIPEDIPYPCIVKPLKSIEGTKQDIRTFDAKEELELYLNENHQTKEFLIQRFIKKEHEVLIIGCRSNNNVVYTPAHIIVNRWVGKGDVGAYGPIYRELPNSIHNDINYDSISNFLGMLNYVGTFSIECGIENDRAYFFEINLRNDGTINYYTKIGVNVPEMFVKDTDTTDITKDNSALYIDEFGDFLNVIRGDISLNEWLRSFRKATVFKYYDKVDKGPFKVFAPKMIRVVASTFIRKLLGHK